MREITIIYDGTIYTYKWIKALLWARKEFEKEGVSINYINWNAFFPVSSIARRQIDYTLSLIERKRLDIVIIAYHYSISNFNNWRGLDKIELLKVLKERSNRIVWLDTADSTGNCQFEVLPYVDVYLKKQLLNDLDLYTKRMYGTKLFTDYYHRKYSLEDSEIDCSYTLLLPQYKNKVKISWNIGISDFWTKSRYCLVRPFDIYVPRMTKVEKVRKTNMFFNGTLTYSPISGFQRRKTIEKMLGNTRTKDPSPTLKMNHKQYIEFIKDSKTAISPFGWGEICYRDFEAFVYGATLVKPDMSKVTTYPNFFVSGETYVPINWDFSNFDEIVDCIGSPEYEMIAQRGQDLYDYYLKGRRGKNDFVNHFLTSIL